MNILTLILIASSVFAVNISRYISLPEGVSEQRFELEKDRATYQKTSNFFDKDKNLSLGTFSAKSKKVAQETDKIIKVLKKIKGVDDFLKKKNSSFNELSDKSPHASFIFLGDFRITKNSNLYPELFSIFERLQKLEWKHESGLKLTLDYKTQSIIKNGKETSSRNFDFEFQCKHPKAPTMCIFKDVGILYLE